MAFQRVLLKENGCKWLFDSVLEWFFMNVICDVSIWYPKVRTWWFSTPFFCENVNTFVNWKSGPLRSVFVHTGWVALSCESEQHPPPSPGWFPHNLAFESCYLIQLFSSTPRLTNSQYVYYLLSPPFSFVIFFSFFFKKLLSY